METEKTRLNRTPSTGGKRSPIIHTHEQWVVELAHNEKAMLLDDTIHIKDEATFIENEKQKQTEYFIMTLRAKCVRLIEIFNQHKGPDTNGIKMFKIAGSEFDFMLFRNTLKLVVMTPKTGLIDVYFSSYIEASKATESQPYVSGERLELVLGLFDEPYWQVKDQRINSDFMLRKFISDFILMSCR